MPLGINFDYHYDQIFNCSTIHPRSPHTRTIEVIERKLRGETYNHFPDEVDLPLNLLFSVTHSQNYVNDIGEKYHQLYFETAD